MYGYICNKVFTLNMLCLKLLIVISMKYQGVKCALHGPWQVAEPVRALKINVGF